MQTIRQDLKYALRAIRQSPGFTLAAIFAIALGIGANTAMFSVVNAVLLNSKPLRALKDPQSLVMVWEKNPSLNLFNGLRFPVALANYLEWKKQSRSFSGLAVIREDTHTVTANAETGGSAERIDGATATSDFFPLIGIQPRLGRGFTTEEMQPGKGRVVILSDELYRSRYHGDPKILGKHIRMESADYQVVGILPPGFQLPATGEGFDEIHPQLWTPVNLAGEGKQRWYYTYGRLKPSVTPEQARAEMDVISKRLEQANPDMNKGFGASVFPIAVEDVSPAVRRSVIVLQAAVCFVLLIACANVANLLLTRAVGREREVSIRMALGAGRLRIVRQMLSESLLLGVLGGAAGLLLATWGLDAIAAVAPPDTHGFKELRLDPMVLGFTVAVAIVAGLLFGLAPALHASRDAIHQVLNRSGRSGVGSSNRLRGALVVSEIAFSFVLLIGAGLMVRSLASVLAVDSGFRLDHLLKMRLSLPEQKYSTPEQLTMFGDRLLAAVRSLPGVQSATLANGVPMQELTVASYSLEGVPARPNETLTADFARVRESYFETLGIRLLRGRLIERKDMEVAKPQPVVVNESFARRNWPNQDALGKIVAQGDSRGSVVGVVADTHQFGPDEAVRPQIYMPESHLQAPMLLVRTAGEPMALAPAIQKQVTNIDKDQPVYSVGTMESVLHDWGSMVQRRFNMTLLIVFAALALVLAAVGLYGVLAYSVSLRTRELGIRLALGAEPRSIARLVVGQGFRLTLIGLAIGLAGALALTRLMQSLMFGVSATDPSTFALVTVTLLAVAATASYLPARRASRVEPMEALRTE